MVLISIKRSIKSGNELTRQQERYLKMAAVSKPKLTQDIREMEAQREFLQKVIDSAKHVGIRVENTVNAGVKIVIKDVSRNINDNISRCKFIREGADIKSVSI